MARQRQIVLADTGPLYAPADRSDQYHEQARKELKLIESSGYRVAVIYPTLLEVQSLAVKWLGSQGARDLVDDLLEGSLLVNPTQADYEGAITRSHKYPDQAITLHDCTVAVICERLGLSVWTYDHHFDVMGVSVWRPTA